MLMLIHVDDYMSSFFECFQFQFLVDKIIRALRQYVPISMEYLHFQFTEHRILKSTVKKDAILE